MNMPTMFNDPWRLLLFCSMYVWSKRPIEEYLPAEAQRRGLRSGERGKEQWLPAATH